MSISKRKKLSWKWARPESPEKCETGFHQLLLCRLRMFTFKWPSSIAIVTLDTMTLAIEKILQRPLIVYHQTSWKPAGRCFVLSRRIRLPAGLYRYRRNKDSRRFAAQCTWISAPRSGYLQDLVNYRNMLLLVDQYYNQNHTYLSKQNVASIKCSEIDFRLIIVRDGWCWCSVQSSV